MNMENIEVLIGSEPLSTIKTRPFKVFDPTVLEFFSVLSSKILVKYKQDPSLREFAGFFFWIRSANLKAVKNEYKNLHRRFGRGGSLHITPSNVPANALFSLAFGLLSGTPSVIRVSSKTKETLTSILKEINKILDLKEFTHIKNYISIISYIHSESINKELSISASSRLLWGGDDTINLFKNYQTSPACVDLCFPNRTSCALISPSKLVHLDKDKYINLIEGFARDIATFSQRACSSPFIIFLLKSDDLDIDLFEINKFLEKVDNTIGDKHNNQISCLDNYKSAIDFLFQDPLDLEKFFKGRHLFVATSKSKPSSKVLKYRPDNACLLLICIESLEELHSLLPDNNQTLVNIPYEESLNSKLIQLVGPLGTDRLVKSGDALNMHLFWDGHDIVSSLSRQVQIY